MKWFQATKECGNVRQTLLGRTPEYRVAARVSDLKRFLWSQSNQSIVKCQPVFGEHADVDIDADSCPGHADGVCAVSQHVRHGHRFCFSRPRERAARPF